MKLAAWLFALALAAPSGFAQDAALEGDPPSDFSFGGQPQDLMVQAGHCVSRVASPRLVQGPFQFFGNDVSALGLFNCPVDVPHGGRITGMECIVRDLSGSDMTIQLQRFQFDTATNTVGASTILASVQSSGNSGYQTLTTTLAAPETVRHRSGSIRNIYYLLIIMPDVANNASLRECTIIWNRQVSPAPAVASFGDVPTTHAQFRFVEALATAGITGGCGGGNFCPDAPLTRGQMAVFLAAALGLHFPN